MFNERKTMTFPSGLSTMMQNKDSHLETHKLTTNGSCHKGFRHLTSLKNKITHQKSPPLQR
jgi:hypothetical protein